MLATSPAVQDDPSLLNTDPLAAGWLFSMALANAQELQALMDEARYQAFCTSASPGPQRAGDDTRAAAA